MKQILLFIVCLFGLGTMAVHAQENSEPADLALYQQAVKALKDKKFFFKVDRFNDNSRSLKADPFKTYVLMEDENVTISCYPNGFGGWAKEGKSSNYRMKTDKKGNLSVTMTFRDSFSGSAKFIFTLEKGSNRCIMTCSPIKYFRKFSLTGELLSSENADLINTFMFLNERKSK